MSIFLQVLEQSNFEIGVGIDSSFLYYIFFWGNSEMHRTQLDYHLREIYSDTIYGRQSGWVNGHL